MTSLQVGRLRARELPRPPVPVGHERARRVQLLRQVVRAGGPRVLRQGREAGEARARAEMLVWTV